VVLVLACVVPAALMVGGLIASEYQRERAQLTAGAIAMARTLVFAVDQRLLVTKAGLTALATSPSLRTPDLANFYEEATATVPDLNAENIVLLGTDGEMLLNTLKPFGTPMPRNRASQLTDVLHTGKPVFADLFVGAVANHPRVAVGVPVTLEGKVAYSINASITPERLQAILLGQRLPADWIAAIADNTGTVVARSRDQERFIGARITANAAQRLTEVAEGAIESTTLEGIPVVAAFSRSGISGWAVVIGIPRDRLTASLRRSMLGLSIATLLLLGFTIALASALGNSIAQPTRDLLAPALALGSGNPVTMPLAQPSFREAAQLGQALEQAAGILSGTNLALVHTEARLGAILESAMDAVIVMDGDHRIVMFNAAAEQLFGYSRQEALGASIGQFLPERLRHGLLERIDEFGRQEGPIRVAGRDQAVIGLRRSGEEFPLEATISQIVEGDRRIYTLIVRDVTDRVRAHDELLRSNLDLQQFAFVASHDLRTPLRSIMGYLQLLEKRHGAGLDPKPLDLIHRALNAVRTLDHLTEDLLSYARLDTQVKPFTAVDCNEVLADTLQLMDAAITEAGASISAGALPVVLGDRGQLVQLFQNLLANAITYRQGPAPAIRVQAAPGEHHDWVLSVADNGIGIEAQHHERIFEIFKRLHTAQEFPGTGIGLAMCRRIVERHGGLIWVTSVVGQGSTFAFTMPIHSGASHGSAT
jgi:PAS domain S-box-containing protein